MIVTPESFRTWISQSQGDAGRLWIASLPEIVLELCEKWQLRIDGEVDHGGLAIAVPVRRADERCFLKISSSSDATKHEVEALRHWDGNGMVRLYESDPERWAMLLEAVGPDSLESLPWRDSIPILGDLIQLHSIEGSDVFPRVSSASADIAVDIERRWFALAAPMPRRLVDMALLTIQDLAPRLTSKMVNKDLHFKNVLRGHRQPWLAIDPKPFVGDPEFGPAQILWCVVDQLESSQDLEWVVKTLAERGSLDPILLREWTLIRVIDYWLWALECGLTEDPRRCARVIDWLDY